MKQKQQRVWRWRRMIEWCVLVTVLAVMSGCSRLSSAEEGSSAASAYGAILPADWSILGDVRAVNLNGAAADADLVLFQFDFGLVGAMIFEDGAEVALDAAHWLLPRHFGDASGFGQGFIAPPGTVADDIHVDVLEGNPSTGGSPSQEMVMPRRQQLPDLCVVGCGGGDLWCYAVGGPRWFWRSGLGGVGGDHPRSFRP